MEPGGALDLAPEPLDVLVPGTADGVLVGGNLAVLAAGAGASGAMPARDSIAVLEDVAEESYRLDRLLTQLLRAGWFDGVRGVVVGHLSGSGPDHEVRATLLDRLAPLGVPVVRGAHFGHEADQPRGAARRSCDLAGAAGRDRLALDGPALR